MTQRPTTSDDILTCARTLIIAGGYNGFSYADISKVVGIRTASIHHHFPSKSDLVTTLVSRYREEARLGLARLEQQVPDPAQLLRSYVGFWGECIANASIPYCVCALLATQIPVLPDDIAREVRAYFKTLSAWLTSVLSRGAEQGKLRLSQPAEVEAEIFMATVHGAMLSARAYGDGAIFTTITQPLLHRLIPE